MHKALIHLVDDDAAVRDAVGSLLRAVGYRVQCHADAASLLLSIRREEHACVLIDIRLVGMNGLRLAEELKLQGFQVPFIFVSGHADVAATVRAFKLGASDLLQKPVPEHVLLDAIEQALQQDQKNRAARAEQTQRLDRLSGLSTREREVLSGIAQGLTNRAMAEAWGVSTNPPNLSRPLVSLRRMRLGVSGVSVPGSA